MNELWQQLRSFKWSSSEPLHAVLCLPGVALPLILGVALGYPGTGVLMAGGAQAVGFGSFQQPLFRPSGPMVAATVGIGISALVGALCRDSTGLLLFATLVWTLLYGLIKQHQLCRRLGRPAVLRLPHRLVRRALFTRYHARPHLQRAPSRCGCACRWRPANAASFPPSALVAAGANEVQRPRLRPRAPPPAIPAGTAPVELPFVAVRPARRDDGRPRRRSLPPHQLPQRLLDRHDRRPHSQAGMGLHRRPFAAAFRWNPARRSCLHGNRDCLCTHTARCLPLSSFFSCF